MKVESYKLDKIVGLTSNIPYNDKNEFVLVGRSNVGKSSFINAFINKKNFAHTSSTPGKTRTINYYLINNKFYIVDLPGYGYAKASNKEKDDWAVFINKYLSTSENIEEIIMLVDIRHAPSDKDISMYKWIVDTTGYEPIIIATKCDKIKKNEIKKNIENIRDTLEATTNCEIISFSSVTKEGLKDIMRIFNELV